MRHIRLVSLIALLAGAVQAAGAQVTSPKEFFGHNIGDDYWLATYDQFVAYWHKIDAESDRIQVVEIGKTAEGRPQLMAIVTAPENFRNLERHKEIAQRLAHARGVTEAQARALATEGRAVVWIDGGLHATEVLGAHQLIETSYELASRDDDETRRILRDDIILLVHANPDGMQLVSSWYMREADPAKRNLNIPRLYQKYVGHDNNRDFYMSNQPETQNINHVLYWEWFPQIVYNHHQTGPAGTVMFAPPFRDPFNYNFDPLVPMELDLVGAAMHSRFEAEGKPGVTMRSGSSYSTWWNGGLRTTVYFHNMIGLLTETIGNPTPMRIPLVPANQLPRADLPFPIAPQEWHFRQSIDYSITANYAVLDLASRYRETLLFNLWRMGMNSIERGSHDSWTITGKDVERLQAVAQQQADAHADGDGDAGAQLYEHVLHDPATRDARTYVIPADQTDFPTATKFVNTLRHVGIEVLRASQPFTVAGRTYPAGSFVISAAQAFRPHVLDMFEPQDHPNDFAYPGGPPKRPYDNAGYTLAYQMGVAFDRLFTAVNCTCDTVSGLAQPLAGVVSNRGAPGFVLSPAQNDAFRTVARLLKSGATVLRLSAPILAGGRTYPAGSFYVASGGAALSTLDAAARELGISANGVDARTPAGTRVRMPRIALADQYGGSMTSGHTRWLLEQFEFPYSVVYPQQLDAGNLRAKYDVIVLTDGAIPAPGRTFGGGAQRAAPPAEFASMTGRITAERALPSLKQFLESGGSVVTIGSSTQLAYMLDLPVHNALVERSPTGEEHMLPPDKFYVPGSILSVAVDSTALVAAGARGHVDVFYDNSPVFRLDPDAQLRGVRPIAWFDSETPLRSGWAWGQSYLDGGVTIAQAKVGQGTLYLFGPEILFRGQPHGTFKFFFNSLLN
ncbi:MAG TPA: M14 family metallopeptidase [Gemmatimonadaceae bacterium]|nr:M14 family metallopeptidase [Gemmatimonadaceae bacterium]